MWTFFFWSTGRMFLPKKVPWLPETSLKGSLYFPSAVLYGKSEWLNLTPTGVVPTLKRLYSWWRWRRNARYNSPKKTGKRGHIPNLSTECTICVSHARKKKHHYKWWAYINCQGFKKQYVITFSVETSRFF